MNDTDSAIDTLDDFERDVARALRAKADQIAVADGPFRPERSLPPAAPAPAPRRARRRTLAVAAAVAVLAGAVIGTRLLGAGDEADVTTNQPAGPVYTMRASGTAAFVAGSLPDGWALQQLDLGSAVSSPSATWQVFGPGGTPPLSRGVLVGSTDDEEGRALERPTRTIHGRPAEVGPSPDPLTPAGVLKASWIEGDVVHDAIAVGLTEDELVAFLDSLTAGDDRSRGFEAPAGAELQQLAATTVDETYGAMLTYAGPGGDSVRVTAQSPDYYGGLLHRLLGEPSGGGFVMRGDNGRDPDYPFVSVSRDDGWTTEVMSDGSATDPGVLEAIADQLEPVTAEQLVEMGVAQPVTATETVGDWTVELHGTDDDTLAMCVSPAGGERACTVAYESRDFMPGVVAGSTIVGGEWVVVTVTDGPEPAIVAPQEPGAVGPDPEWARDHRLDGEQERSGDHAVEVFTVPADVDAVQVLMSPSENEAASGVTYERPER
jgi:hypothetical protein